MNDKAKTDKPRIVKVRNSLRKKTFIRTLMLTFGIGIAMLIVGTFLYTGLLAHQFTVNTWNLANAEAAAIDQTDYLDLSNRILDIYDSCSDEERGDGTSQEYLDRYAGIRESEEFGEVLEAMHSLQSRNGPLNAFLVALDPETDRMIYLVDADQREDSTCRPGTWDDYPDDIVDALIKGRELSILDRAMEVDSPIQAVFTNFKSYGPRCTAAATLSERDNYTIVVCVDEKLGPVIRIGKLFLAEFVLLLLIITLLAAYIGMKMMGKAFVDPVNKLAAAAKEYGEDSEKKEGKRHFEDLNINTGDELERLADTLRDMESDVADYMVDLKNATAEEERIATEISLASRIQMSMLQTEFPVFSDRKEFDIYASMEPAKGVGGDFYDMILIDEDHIAVEIADVSGKGIPAALFMTVSKILLADAIRDGKSPSDILREVNETICAGNEEEMFVTVWLGILNINTGVMITSNAGHEYPVLVHADGRAEMIRDKHGFVIGGMEGRKYPEHVIQLEKGDSIFVYTDGVTEASTVDNRLYGTDRVLEAAGSAGEGAGPAQIMKAVRDDIDDFIGEAEQFDDLTMLCIRYNGAE